MPVTPNRKLPYPVPPDPADVPADMQALALALDLLPTVRVLGTASGPPASGSYTTPEGCSAIWVEVIGAGGGGGGCPQTDGGHVGGGGGGGSGGYAAAILPAGTYAYAQGAGGEPQIGAQGGNGGDTTFGPLIGHGGAGGAAANQNYAPWMAAGGPGGAAEAGGLLNALLLVGDAGESGLNLGGAPPIPAGGKGGAAPRGGGGAHSPYGGGLDGNAANIWGGGGSGCSSNPSNPQRPGGRGAPGVIIVHEIY